MSDNLPPQNDDDLPRFLEDDEPQTHPLFSNLTSRPAVPEPPAPQPEEKSNLRDDIQHFIAVTRGKKPPAEEPAPPVEAPQPPPEAKAEEELVIEIESVPEDIPEEALYETEFVVEEELVTEPIPGVLPPPPAPEIQSSFVNPALARVAAARPRRRASEPNEIWLGVRAIVIVTVAALIVAFIFSYWTPESFLSDEFVTSLQEVSSTQGPPTAVPSPLPTFSSVAKVGLITGHSGPPLNPAFTEDPGAICDENFDGIPELRELDLNTSVSYRVADMLIQAGFQVEMLNEWDPRLDNYRADTLVSIHTNTCENLGFGATGFNVTAYERSPMIDRDNILVDCVAQSYSTKTGLPRHFGSPPDLIDYHAFRQVSVDTPTIIVELGFMFADRQVLTERTEDMALGIYEGILCFLKPEALTTQSTPEPAN